MFILNDTPRFPVTVRPSIPGAGRDEFAFVLTMSAARSSDALVMSRRLADAAAGADIQALVEAEIADLQPLIHGWTGVVDAEGAEVRFSPEALAQLLDLSVVRAAIYRAYADALREAQGKN